MCVRGGGIGGSMAIQNRLWLPLETIDYLFIDYLANLDCGVPRLRGFSGTLCPAPGSAKTAYGCETHCPGGVPGRPVDPGSEAQTGWP